MTIDAAKDSQVFDTIGVETTNSVSKEYTDNPATTGLKETVTLTRAASTSVTGANFSPFMSITTVVT